MNKQQRKNIGLDTTFIVIASVIGLLLLLLTLTVFYGGVLGLSTNPE
jgi:hypothetical protein